MRRASEPEWVLRYREGRLVSADVTRFSADYSMVVFIPESYEARRIRRREEELAGFDAVRRAVREGAVSIQGDA